MEAHGRGTKYSTQIGVENSGVKVYTYRNQLQITCTVDTFQRYMNTKMMATMLNSHQKP